MLSENLAAVEALLSNAPDLNITLRNEANNTALGLSKWISGVTSAQMEDLLSLKWSQYEEVAAQKSAQVEQELIDLALKEDEGASDRKKLAAAKSGKKKTKKSKKKGNTSGNASKDSQLGSAEANATQSANPSESNDSERVSTETLSTTDAEEQTTETVSEAQEADDEGSWQSVLPKKSRKCVFFIMELVILCER